jgi:hypothetical protein
MISKETQKAILEFFIKNSIPKILKEKEVT